MEMPRKTRGNPAEIPRQVEFFAIARKFRGNGNLNPCCIAHISIIYIQSPSKSKSMTQLFGAVCAFFAQLSSHAKAIGATQLIN